MKRHHRRKPGWKRARLRSRRRAIRAGKYTPIRRHRPRVSSLVCTVYDDDFTEKVLFKIFSRRAPHFPVPVSKAPGTLADIIFVVDEKKHPQFERGSRDLIKTVTGICTRRCSAPAFRVHLGWEIDQRGGAQIVSPKCIKVLMGEDMPLSRPKQQGDLQIKFDIRFPKELSGEQRSAEEGLPMPSTNLIIHVYTYTPFSPLWPLMTST